MAILLSSFLTLSTSVLALIVLLAYGIVLEIRWISRTEYVFRCRYRNWDAYGPVLVPKDLSYDVF